NEVAAGQEVVVAVEGDSRRISQAGIAARDNEPVASVAQYLGTVETAVADQGLAVVQKTNFSHAQGGWIDDRSLPDDVARGRIANRQRNVSACLVQHGKIVLDVVLPTEVARGVPSK